MRIVTVDQMRRIEAAADAGGLSYDTMMDNAGRATAVRALALTDHLTDPRFTLLVGAGNNGGDGLVAARYIAEKLENAQVRCYLLKRRENDSNFDAARAAGVFMAYAEDDHDGRVLRHMVASADLLLDALFGIGIRLPIQGEAEKVLRTTNRILQNPEQPAEAIITATHPEPQLRTRVLAVDCPSGVDCDTGQCDANTIPADETITFIAAKPGLLTAPGADVVGKLHIAIIGVSPDLPELNEAGWTLATGPVIRELLPPRPTNSHKGTFGKAMIVAGSVNFTGAAALSAGGAYRAGAGLVTVGAPGPVVSSLASTITEPTWIVLPHDMGVISENAASIILESLTDYTALLLGPGWGQEDTTGNLLQTLLQPHPRRAIGFTNGPEEDQDVPETNTTLPPLVIDADGLNLLAKIDEWWKLLPENTIITPHPAEMARLARMETGDIQANRWQLAVEKAAKWHVIVVLKGAHTVVAAPDGQMMVMPFNTDALATAGTGDVLAGLITGLLAQKAEPFSAAVTGAYLHGLAGQLAGEAGHNRSVIASDVLNTIPDAWKRL